MNQLKNRLGLKSDRTKNIVKHIGWSAFYKAGSMLANFMLVPLCISFLGQEDYGLWLTIISFIGWFSVMDIGLGNGLRNKFAEARANNNSHLARIYVSCAYVVISIIVLMAILLFLLGNFFFDWSLLFNNGENISANLSFLMPLVFTFFSLQLVAKLILTLYAADQHHSEQGKIEFLVQSFSLVLVYVLSQTSEGNLVLFGGLFTGLPLVLLLVFNIMAFSTKYKAFKPSFSLWDWRYVKDITGLGISFFFIQIATTVLLSTDNIIISNLFGLEEVVPYNVALKYFSVVLVGYGMITAPYWASFTEAFQTKDYNWIKNSVKNIQKIWLIVPLLLLIMLLLSNWFYAVWVGKAIEVPLSLSIAVIVFVLIATFQSIYFKFINALGKVRLQLYMYIFSLVINIPLSYLLAKIWGMGLAGVIWATSICMLFTIIIGPLQFNKLINQTATGVWNK
ncbi:MAG: hypothetical protein NWQ38_14715 [Cellulophaga sp.]|nr:hypothetical protein [Cellulophaga sp.]